MLIPLYFCATNRAEFILSRPHKQRPALGKKFLYLNENINFAINTDTHIPCLVHVLSSHWQGTAPLWGQWRWLHSLPPAPQSQPPVKIIKEVVRRSQPPVKIIKEIVQCLTLDTMVAKVGTPSSDTESATLVLRTSLHTLNWKSKS